MAVVMVCVGVWRRVGQPGLLDTVRAERRVTWKWDKYLYDGGSLWLLRVGLVLVQHLAPDAFQCGNVVRVKASSERRERGSRLVAVDNIEP